MVLEIRKGTDDMLKEIEENRIKLYNAFIDKLMLCEDISIKTDYEGEYQISPSHDSKLYVIILSASSHHGFICQDSRAYELMGLNEKEKSFAYDMSGHSFHFGSDKIDNEAFHSLIMMHEMN